MKPVPCTSVVFHRPDGSTIAFSGTPGTVGNYPEEGGGGLATLTFSSSGTYTLHDENADTLVFSSAGQLQSIKDPSGVGWTITNDSSGRPAKVTRTGGQAYTLAYHLNTTTGDNPATTTVTVTDPAGNVYQYIKQGMPNGTIYHGPFEVNSVTFPGSPATTLTYKYATGNTDVADLTETDINGVPYSYGTYDSNYEATGTRLADGSDAFSIVYAFPSGGMTATVTNPLGHTTVDNYKFIDGQYLLTSVNDDAVSDCGATTHTAAYDSNGNLTKTVDNNGVTTTYSYAASGQLQTTTEASGTTLARKTDYTWDSNLQLNRPLSVTVEGESKTTYTYNAQNRLASVAHTNLTSVGTANQSLKTTYAYTLYSDGMVKTMTVTLPSPNGTDHTTYAYDSYGNLTSVTDGLSHVTTYSNYNGLGEVGKVVGPNGDETDYTYDARGRVASKTMHPNGTTATWTYAYDGFGLLKQVSAPDGEVVVWNRDAEERVKTTTHNDKDGTSTETFTYDANNDITSDVVSRGSDVGKSRTFVYDGLGRVYQAKGADGQVLTYAYDGNGNVLSVTDMLGHQTTYAYDDLNRVEGVMDAAGGVTSYAYDAGDHITGVTDPRLLVTTYNYDGLGQLWKQVSPDTGTSTFVYDSSGRMASRTRNSGITTSYTYDGLDRLTSETAGGVTRSYTWDTCTNGKGRLCTAEHVNDDTVSYSYTPEGYIATRSFSFISGDSYALGYAYDNVGHLASVTYPDGNIANYDYSHGAVADVRLEIGASNVYAASGVVYRPMDMAMSGWTSSNSLANSIGYDHDLRPTSISVPNVESLGFTYDAANRITHITNGMNGSLTQTLGYDALNRLATIASTVDNESYTYDANGNRIHKVLNGTSINITVASNSNRLLVSGGTTYGYDADGNVLTANTTTLFHYDPFGRVDVGNATWSYTVSAENQRLRESGLAMTYFAPDQSGVLLAEELSGTWQDYVYLNGRLVSVVKAGQVYAAHGDQTGRTLTLTNSARAVVWQAEGLPFTTPITTNSFGAFNFEFPGQYEAHGHTHNGYREYNGYLGRYAQSDPIGLAGGINTYVYVGNNPVSNIDPLGLCDQQKCAKATAVVAALGRALSSTGSGLTWTGVGLVGVSVVGGIFAPEGAELEIEGGVEGVSFITAGTRLSALGGVLTGYARNGIAGALENGVASLVLNKFYNGVAGLALPQGTSEATTKALEGVLGGVGDAVQAEAAACVVQ